MRHNVKVINFVEKADRVMCCWHSILLWKCALLGGGGTLFVLSRFVEFFENQNVKL